MSLTTNWVPAYVALGSNLDEPELQVETALVRLAAIPRTQRVINSRLYAPGPYSEREELLWSFDEIVRREAARGD